MNDQHITDRNIPEIILIEDAAGKPVAHDSSGMDVDYHSSFEIYSAELNQIFDWHWLAVSAGARYQAGTFETDNLLNHPTSVPFLLNDPPAADKKSEDFERVTGYGYVTVKPVEQLRLTGGVAYDQESFPVNYRQPPIHSGEDHRAELHSQLHWTVGPYVHHAGNRRIRPEAT